MISEADYERLVDLRVQRRLSVDREYLNAEDAESQAIREQQITEQVERVVTAHYGRPA